MKVLGARLERGSLIIILLFAAVASVDIFTSLKVGKFLEYLELNPIYPYVGMAGIMGANLLMAFVIFFVYSKGNIFVRYTVCSFLTYIVLARIWIIQNNFKVLNQIATGEITMETVRQVPQAAKVAQYSLHQLWFLLIPLIVSYVIYLLFMIDHKVEKRCHTK